MDANTQDSIPLASMEELNVGGSPQPLQYRRSPAPSYESPRSKYAEKSKYEVSDRLNLVYFIILLHGVGTLMPWNMFITAESYFTKYKLNVNSTDPSIKEYRNNFLSYLGLASQIPNIICNALNLLLQTSGGNLTLRIVCSLVVEVIIFILTVVLAMVDSTSWPDMFFYATMVLVVLLNMANGVYQNSVFGVAANLPMRYSNAVVLGANISGTLASIINIISIAASPNLKTAAIYYFITAIFVLLACFDTYFALPLTRFYRYHRELTKTANKESKCVYKKPPFFLIFKKIWPQCFNVFFVFFVTLTIFPAVHANIEAIDPNFIIPPDYFSPVTCFLCFNFFAMLGSIFPTWITRPGPRFLWIPVVLRVVLIPYFMLCNYKPEKRKFPVFINNDWAYISMAVVLGLSSGYFSSLSMMYAPRCVEPQYASTAGMMAALFLILGIVSGVNFSFFISWLIETPLF
ncbi:equilibrative nucleoside transporter 3 [Centruroides vittatus]|uniref:equilibrative nucleoside transporter 3 n=1 Tax=Centruroides vittatus TaxID=120091 RepID=UPI003510B967